MTSKKTITQAQVDAAFAKAEKLSWKVEAKYNKVASLQGKIEDLIQEIGGLCGEEAVALNKAEELSYRFDKQAEDQLAKDAETLEVRA